MNRLALGLILSLLACRPRDPCPIAEPLPPPAPGNLLGGGLDGFDSPYLGHTGSWDGQGGDLGGSSKNPAMDQEVALGLRWTFMPVYWNKLEPEGPVDLAVAVPDAWQALDAFVIEAHNRGLNILMQPTIGGNAGGPPEWAGTRAKNSSAPEDMDGLVDFIGKLTERYQPGGTLAQEQGFDDGYGVRAWELDNEPEFYRKFDWGDEPGDYAEFFVKSAARMKELDPEAVVLGPAVAHGEKGTAFLEAVLDASQLVGSDTFVANGQGVGIGPSMDVVSFHIYEGNNFDCIECRFSELREVVERFEGQPGFEYERKLEYWHTEGNYQFLKMIREELRANWRWQFFTRAFAAGVRKVNVMDPGNEQELTSIQRYVQLFPDPFPMFDETDNLGLSREEAFAFRHPGRVFGVEGNFWIIWAANGAKDTSLSLPAEGDEVLVLDVDGTETRLPVVGGLVSVPVEAKKISPPRVVIDAP